MNRELQAGDVVGEYTVDRKIGEGSFGKVYAARHPLIGKTVAIKVLNPMFAANADIVERFVTEARAVNEIRHRNIIDIFSFGTLDSGLHYFVMELLEGKTFEDYIRERGKLTPEVALPILKDIAKALEAAHKKGIAHRDLKPENVFLSFDEDGACFPKLLDFGIAKLLGDGPGSHKTATGMPMGTPLYMAPEQCKGTNVDHRADIYAFGIMAHEALSGRRPFDGDSVMEIMMAQIASDPPPLSRHAPMLPATLDGPILQMLAKEPSQRPQTIKQAMDTLLAAQRDAPPSPWEGADAGAETCWPVAPPAPPWGSGAMGAAAVSSAAVSSAAVSSAAVSSAAVSPPAPTLAPTGVSAAAPAAATLEPGYSAAMARVQAQPSTLVSAEPARPSSKVPTALLAGGVALVAVVGLVVAFGLRGTEAAPAAAASASATATASPEPSATAEVALGTTIGGKIPAKGSIVEDEVQAVFRAGFVAQGTPVTMDARQRLHRRISVQAANDWQITEAEVHFPVHTSQVELFRQSGEKLNNEADKDPVEGKSYRVISKDGGLTVTALDGQAVADPERKTVEEEVGLLLQPQPAMFTRPLQVGDEVTPPPALMRFWIGDANKGAFAREGRMTLRSVEQDGDHRLAVFDTTVTYGFDDDDVSVRVAMTGTLSLDVESGLPRVMSLEGPLTGELTVAPGQKVQMTGVMKIARGKPGAVSISLDPAATP